MTYTDEQVIEIVRDRIKLLEKIEVLEKKISRLGVLVGEAEGKYNDLAKGCVQMFVREGNIRSDSFVVEVRVPAFMSQEDLSVAVTEHIKGFAVKERAEKFFDRGESLPE